MKYFLLFSNSFLLGIFKKKINLIKISIKNNNITEKMKVILILLLLFSLSYCNELKLYKITEKCIQCLEKLNSFDTLSLLTLRKLEIVSLDDILALSRDGVSIKTATLKCLNSYGEAAPEDGNNVLERQIHNKIVLEGTECSDSISSSFSDRQKWKQAICSAYNSFDFACIPFFSLSPEESNYLKKLCQSEDYRIQ